MDQQSKPEVELDNAEMFLAETLAATGALRVKLANPAHEPLFEVILYATQMGEELLGQIGARRELLNDPAAGELLGRYAEFSMLAQRLLMNLLSIEQSNPELYRAWDAAQQETAAWQKAK
jgi:hypothetical protein